MRRHVALEINGFAFLSVLGLPQLLLLLLYHAYSDRESRECTPSSPNAHFFGRSPVPPPFSSPNGGVNRLAVTTSSSGSDEGPGPDHHNSSSQEAVDRQELIAKEKTIDAYVNFKRYPMVDG